MSLYIHTDREHPDNKDKHMQPSTPVIPFKEKVYTLITQKVEFENGNSISKTHSKKLLPTQLTKSPNSNFKRSTTIFEAIIKPLNKKISQQYT